MPSGPRRPRLTTPGPRVLPGAAAGWERLVAVNRLHDPHRRHFASDNYAGVHPEVLAALAEANGGHERAYGYDAYTTRLQEVLAGHFGADARAYPCLLYTSPSPRD